MSVYIYVRVAYCMPLACRGAFPHVSRPAQVLERRGDVLLVPPQQLEANMDALEQGLG